MGNQKKDKEDQPSWIELFVYRKIFNHVLKKLNNMELKGSWRTSTVGWLTLILAFGGSVLMPILDGNPSTHIDFSTFLNALQTAGIAIPVWLIGILSRDNKVSSEKAGAK